MAQVNIDLNKIKPLYIFLIIIIIILGCIYYFSFIKDIKNIENWLISKKTEKTIETPIITLENSTGSNLEVLSVEDNLSLIKKVEDFSTWTLNTYYTINYKNVLYKGEIYNKNNYFLLNSNNEFYLEDKIIDDKNQEVWKETLKVNFLDNLKETDGFKDYKIKNPNEYFKDNLKNEYLIYWIIIKNPANETDKILLVEKIYKTELRKTNENLISSMMEEIVETSSKYTGKELDEKILEIKQKYWFKKE